MLSLSLALSWPLVEARADERQNPAGVVSLPNLSKKPIETASDGFSSEIKEEELPWRGPCQKNSDCKADWVCLPNTKPTCTVTGEECTIDPTKYLLGKPTLCFNNGTGECRTASLNGWGLCFEGSQGKEPRFNHSPRGCKDDQDCLPVWSKKDQTIVQSCLKDPAVTKYIGYCDGQATPPVMFCNPDLKFNNCKTAIGECKVRAFCYPPDEAQKKLEAAEDIAKVDSSGGGPTSLD